jgi:hypothetical protein
MVQAAAAGGVHGNNLNTINVGGNIGAATSGAYHKFIDHAQGLDRGTSNITPEEIAALYSNVLAT